MNKVLSVFFLIIGVFLFNAVVFLEMEGGTAGALILLGMAIMVFSAMLFNAKDKEGPESF